MANWKKLSWVKRSRQRQKLLALLVQARTPTEIAEELDIHISQASRSIREMDEMGVVEILNPDDKLGRLYKITPDGKELLEELD